MKTLDEIKKMILKDTNGTQEISKIEARGNDEYYVEFESGVWCVVKVENDSYTFVA